MANLEVEPGKMSAATRRDTDEDTNMDSSSFSCFAPSSSSFSFLTTRATSCRSILSSKIRKMCCFWPLQKCVKVLSCFETLIIFVFAYKSFNILMDTLNNPHWTTIISFLFFTAFLICQILGTVFIFLAAHRNIARYCLPRLVLITGLAICSFIAAVLLIVYLTKSSQAVNPHIYDAFEYFFGEELTDVDKNEMKHQLKYYAFGFSVLAVIYFIYNCFNLWLTFKFRATLNDFEAVPTEASAPQLSHNPEFGAPPVKSYPNMA